jgi:hypothetical protein
MNAFSKHENSPLQKADPELLTPDGKMNLHRVKYRQLLENPRIVPLAWFRHFLEEQEDVLGKDPWVYGLGETNRKTLETLMRYSQEQGMIG